MAKPHAAFKAGKNAWYDGKPRKSRSSKWLAGWDAAQAEYEKAIRRRRGAAAANPACRGWAYEHPWMTFFLAQGVISTAWYATRKK